EETHARRTASVDEAGSYRVTISATVNGSFGFHPRRCQTAFSIDGAEQCKDDYGWAESDEIEKSFEVAWEAGEHQLAFDVTPLPAEASGDDPDALFGDEPTHAHYRVRRVRIEGPLNPPRWAHPANYERFFTLDEPPAEPDARREYAAETLRRFTARAFRRPADDETVARLVELADAHWQREGSSFEAGVAHAMMAALASPRFLLRIDYPDPTDAAAAPERPQIDEYSLASRLSYFLWSSMPDERLLELAKNSKLHTVEQLQAEVERMLADPKSQALVENFAGQWLQLRDLPSLSPDPQLYAAFDEDLRHSMRRETELLFAHIIAENRSVLELLQADYSFVDGRLAKHYGLSGIEGEAFRRVDMRGKRRGVLMHASILMLTSNPTRTSPVKRGKWVMDNLLDEPPPPPPPDVPTLESGGLTLGTLRQQMEQHRADPNCAVCHTTMDVLGFGLENFDAIGQWREQDGRHAINPSGALPGGGNFEGPLELVQILAEDKQQEFTRCMARRMLTYALGRGLGVADRCAVHTIVEKLSGDGHRFATLVKAIVASPPFLFQESGR
ncbi:MAG: DUF1592 domain-containing protein, partial [Planctomycetales bacterium]|nr:DUF1592 domain-containing protein [Planctomycetales bacterium]